MKCIQKKYIYLSISVVCKTQGLITKVAKDISLGYQICHALQHSQVRGHKSYRKFE